MASKASTLSDNFNDNVIDTAKWSTYGTGVAEVNQRVEIRPLVAAAGLPGHALLGDVT